MTRFSIVLLVALVLSGLYLVKTSYESRRLFVELERAKAEEAQLTADAKRLDAERRTEATSSSSFQASKRPSATTVRPLTMTRSTRSPLAQ